MPKGIYPRKDNSMPVRFWAKVSKSAGCWLWNAGTDTFGYGEIKNSGFDVNLRPRLGLKAHRVSYILHFGEIPSGMLVLHKCDVPACVNPEHLFLGSQLDNMRDRLEKGRNNPYKKLSDSDVLAIRASTEPQRALAKTYNVSQGAIASVKTGRNRSSAWRQPSQP